MRNIYLIPTPNSTNLYRNLLTDKFFILENTFMDVSECNREYQYIYITSDEQIKEGDWILDTEFNTVEVAIYNQEKYSCNVCKKIILTTDPELIEKGVQPIPYEFLQWFVKNPSCEMVDVRKDFLDDLDVEGNAIPFYEIFIPQEETKKTLEENEFCHYSGLPSPAAYEIQKPKEFTLEQVELISNEMVNWALDNIGNPNAKSGEKFDEVVSKYKNL